MSSARAHQNLITLTLAALIAACSTSETAVVDAAATILPNDPRFNVFQLSNSAGDGSFANSKGYVYLSFATSDARYCRAARFPADRAAILACRNHKGWQIEATSALEQRRDNVTREVNEAVLRLNPRATFLNEREVVDAAKRDWQ